MTIYKSYNAALPQGPLAELANLGAYLKTDAQLIAKLEFLGSSGNMTDKVASGMLALAAARGELQRGDRIIEASSGAFAVSLAIAAALRGYKLTLCMPAFVAEARQSLLNSLGAEIVQTPVTVGRAGAVQKAQALSHETGGYFINYLENDDNLEVHRRTTGPDILKATDSQLDVLVCGVTSGGCISGTSEHIKGWTNGVHVVAVEPMESQVLAGGFAGNHGISGLGLPFIAQNYNPYIVDEILPVRTGDALLFARQVFLLEGVPASPVSGAILAAAAEIAKRPDSAGKRIIAILPSRREF